MTTFVLNLPGNWSSHQCYLIACHYLQGKIFAHIFMTRGFFAAQSQAPAGTCTSILPVLRDRGHEILLCMQNKIFPGTIRKYSLH